MDPDIRPQDDLFGHVNGRWLEDTETIQAKGLRPVKGLLERAHSIDDLTGLAAFLGIFERIGGPGLFGSYITPDRADASRNIVYLAQGGLGLPDESYYRDDKFAEIREKYLAYLTTLLTLREHDDPAGAAARVLAYETRLAEGHWEAAETRDVQKTTNHKSLEELVELCPAFEWVTYVTALGGTEETLRTSIVMQPDFFAHLSTVLEETPIETWRDILHVRVVRSSAPYLPDEFVEANFDFYGRTLNGTPELRARWKRGVDFVEGAIGEAVGKVYVARHFPPTSKQMMDELVANLVTAYRRSIEALDWMGEDTKQKAYDKLDRFYPKIGYPTEFRDYSALTISADDLMANVNAASAFETDRQLEKVGQPVDRDEWLMLPQTVNAYYHPGTNEICFPAAILQPPFFSPDAEEAENYGGIGAVIGHELGHGFDDQGAQFDASGRLRDWWTRDDLAHFQKAAAKLVAQFNEYKPFPDLAVNGQLTLSENLADLAGVAASYDAYRASLAGKQIAPDADRQFFLGYANAWRTKLREQTMRQRVLTDGHAPAQYRTAIVRNLEPWYQAFDVQPGQKLYLAPADRVRVW